MNNNKTNAKDNNKLFGLMFMAASVVMAYFFGTEYFEEIEYSGIIAAMVQASILLFIMILVEVIDSLIYIVNTYQILYTKPSATKKFKIRMRKRRKAEN